MRDPHLIGKLKTIGSLEELQGMVDQFVKDRRWDGLDQEAKEMIARMKAEFQRQRFGRRR